MSRLCMFHPVRHPLERGWVGRVEGDRVVHLAAQTLQSFFSGGGTAREHAEYALADVRLLPPVLHPPSMRIFDDQESFAFANPAAIVGPGATVTGPSSDLDVLPRVAVVIGADQGIGGFTVLAEWRAKGIRPPKDRDFALGLGPVVVSPDDPDLVASGTLGRFDWPAALALAAAGTTLYPGDVLAAPAAEPLGGAPGDAVTIAIAGIGALEQRVEADARDDGE